MRFLTCYMSQAWSRGQRVRCQAYASLPLAAAYITSCTFLPQTKPCCLNLQFTDFTQGESPQVLTLQRCLCDPVLGQQHLRPSKRWHRGIRGIHPLRTPQQLTPLQIPLGSAWEITAGVMHTSVACIFLGAGVQSARSAPFVWVQVQDGRVACYKLQRQARMHRVRGAFCWPL